MYISKTILFLLVTGIIVLILYTCNHLHPTPIQDSSEQVDTLEWMNDAGDIVSSLKGTPQAFAVERKEADSIAKVYRVREKNLLEYIVALQHSLSDVKPSGAAAADYFPMDTLKNCPPQIRNLRQAFSSPYYKAAVQIGDSSFMHLESFDTVTVVWKRVREGSIFNRRNFLQVDVSMANPDTKVYGLKAYRMQEKKRKVSVGLQVGYGLSNSMKPMPYVGVGLQYNIINF